MIGSREDMVESYSVQINPDFERQKTILPNPVPQRSIISKQRHKHNRKYKNCCSCLACFSSSPDSANANKNDTTTANTINNSNSNHHNSNETENTNNINDSISTKDENKNTPEKVERAIPIYAFELTTNEDEWWLDSKMIKQDNDFTKTITLMILDPQNDFHYGQGSPGDADYRPNGSLAVPGTFYIYKYINVLQVYTYRF